MSLLKVDKLTVQFGGIKALTAIDFAMEEKEILAIIGPNGAGKTTFFNCVSGVYHPTSGEILYAGESLLGLSPDRIARRGVGRTFQNIRLFNNISVHKKAVLTNKSDNYLNFPGRRLNIDLSEMRS